MKGGGVNFTVRTSASDSHNHLCGRHFNGFGIDAGDSGSIRVLPRFRRCAGGRWDRCRCCPGRAFHAHQARSRVSDPRHRLLPARAGLQPEQIDYVGFYDKPLLKFERLLETYLMFAPRGSGRSPRRCRFG